MDWTIAYQITALLAVTLLAIVVTIFVLASSLLGLAVESASKEEEDKRAEQERLIAEQVERARMEFDKAAKGTRKFEQTEKELKNLEKQRGRFEKETKRIRRGYEVFTPKGGVLYPGIPLLVSLVLSAFAWGLGMGTYQSVSPYLWGFGVAVLGFSLYRIYFGLKRIERVAVTSEQAALTKMTKALGTALEKHDEAMKPRLEFKFCEKEPPFHTGKESTLDIEYRVELMQGDIVRKAEIWFFAPPSFSFPDQATFYQRANFGIPSACTCKQVFTDMLRGYANRIILKLKAPVETGTFTLGYTMHYEGSIGELQKFKVVVE